MKWLKNALIVFSGCLPETRYALGLQADEQIKVSNRAQNPIEPLDAFPRALTEGRKTLVMTDGELPSTWRNYLEKYNHHVEIAADLGGLVSNGAYKFDSIIVMNSSKLSKRHINRLIKFYDTRWSMPAAYDDHRAVNARGLRLPPSLLILNDLPSSYMLEEFGLKKNGKNETRTAADVESNLFGLANKIIDKSLAFSNHTLNCILDSPLAHPVLSWRDNIWFGAVIHGDVSWSRALILPDAEELCAAQDMTECSKLFQWVFHRAGVLTWSNLQHRRLLSGREYDEYDGSQRSDEYTAKELAEMEFETVDTYKIRDELILTFDVHALRGDGTADEPFRWGVPNANDTGSFYGSFEMMVPYWRKPLTVYDRVSDLARSESNRESYLIRGIQKYGASEILGLKKNLSVMAHIKAPRQHGVYKFVIRPISERWRLNTPIWVETLLPLRTYLHDIEEPRAIWSAFPFYLSIGFMALAPLYVLQGSF